MEEEACGCGRVAVTVEEVCTCGRATVAVVEEASLSDVDGGGGDWRSRERAAGT
jgi:hypothetical protein